MNMTIRKEIRSALETKMTREIRRNEMRSDEGEEEEDEDEEGDYIKLDTMR